MKSAERNYFQSELEKNQNNMRKSWSLIKDVINRNNKNPQKLPKLHINGIPCEDSQQIANSFIKFFTNIGTTLHKKNPKTNIDPISFIPKNYTIDIKLEPTTEEEVSKSID
jgi:hypothetical protein